MFGDSQQALGLGGYGATQSPEKKARQEDKQTCMPGTIRLLLDAHRAVEGKGTELLLHGQEVANVTLVGVVEGLVRQATMTEFTLNDASGRVAVRHYQNSDSAEKNDGIEAGHYVSVVGSLRTSPAVHVSALSMRAIKDADEVSYHMIEVAHAALMMQSGGTQAPRAPTANMLSQPARATTSAATPPPAPAAVAVAIPAAAGDALPTAVLAVLKREGESRPEGVPLTVIQAACAASPASAVREALQQLVTDGEAFTTIDDDHFSPL